jgi:hypothetical protein
MLVKILFTLFFLIISFAYKPNEESCYEISSESEYVSLVSHCRNVQDYGGYFKLVAKSKSPVIRGRITGPVIQEMKAIKTSEFEWRLNYEFVLRGTFFSNIRLQYNDFNPSNITASLALSQNIITNHIFSNPVSCEFGASKLRGYWESRSHSEEIGMYKHGKLRWDVAGRLKFKYVPNTCSLMSNEEIILGLNHHKICLFGDSHTRELQNSMTLFSSDFKSANHTLIKKQVLLSNFTLFYEDSWGNCFNNTLLTPLCPLSHPLLNFTTMICDLVLINIGQWPASGNREKVWSLERYSDAVQTILLESRRVFGPQKVGKKKVGRKCFFSFSKTSFLTFLSLSLNQS